MFAVIKTGGKQYKVASGDMLRVERIAANAGDKVQFNEVLMLGGDKPVLGAPMIKDTNDQDSTDTRRELEPSTSIEIALSHTCFTASK